MTGIEGYLRAVLLTILAIEAAILGSRLFRRDALLEHLWLLLLVAAIAVDEIAAPGPAGSLASFAVLASAGSALAPRHRSTRLLWIGSLLASGLVLAAAWGRLPARIAEGASMVALVSLASCAATFLFLRSSRTSSIPRRFSSSRSRAASGCRPRACPVGRSRASAVS